MISCFDKKCQSRGTATVGYFGGSITGGARSSEPEKKSWRALTTAWLRARHPRAEIREVNAAVGGTSSDYGLCRMSQDLLIHRPDLVFVEFAVNDEGLPPERTARSYEGVIRGLRKALPEKEIVALHTISPNMVTDYEKGGMPAVVGCHQRICDHYGVPAVNVGNVLCTHMVERGLKWSDFIADNVHPSDVGHAHYALTLQTALAGSAVKIPSAMPPPLNDGVWIDGSLRTGDVLEADPEWARERLFVWATDMRLVRCTRPGATLTIPFAGSVIGLLCLRHAASGVALWSVDGGPEQRCVIWDEYCPKFRRAGYLVLADDLPAGDHVLRVGIAGDVPAGSTGTAVDLYGIMTAKREQGRQ